MEKKPDGIEGIAVLPEGYNGERSESADILPVVNAWRTRWSVQKSAKIAGGVQGVDGPGGVGSAVPAVCCSATATPEAQRRKDFFARTVGAAGSVPSTV